MKTLSALRNVAGLLSGHHTLRRRNHIKAVAALFFACLTCHADPSPAFYRALHQVETGGRVGAIRGDGGRALGPYQIHRAYWQDSRVAGRYEDCASEPYARKVVAAYLKRYAPAAYKDGDNQTLARVHNGGPNGANKQATVPYWNKVKRHL